MTGILRQNIFATIILATSLSFFPVRLAAQTQAPPGPIRLFVDATQAPQKILHAHMQLPVAPGPLTLYYAKWIPGEHEPDGPIINVAGLKFTAAGKPLAWRRDLLNMFAVHLEIPAGVDSLDVGLDFLLSAPTTGFSAGASATPFIDDLSWNQVLLYPAGYAASDLTYIPSLRIPPGWQFATALPGAKRDGDTIAFSPVSLDTLVDSPVLAGKFFRVIALTPGKNPSHEMDIAADSAAALDMPEETQAQFRALVAETGALFGPRHYRDYHFLLTLSDDVAHFGLEHHESSDDRVAERSLIDESGRVEFADLLPHEFVHSWNGKYLRPQDLFSPDYQQPMKDDLLWVYEGLTEYLGEVLTARSGLLTLDQAHDALAEVAGTMATRPGREWRSLQDTADAAPFLYDAGHDWENWRRGTDFYEEGELLWLDVDSTIRRITGDKKSMNDFCRAFYAGGPPNQPALKTYTFDDIVAALTSIAPFDWRGFLRQRLDSIAPDTPTESVENSGWKIAFTGEPNATEETRDTFRGRMNLTFSIGLLLDMDGNVTDVIHASPAYTAGIGPGMKITAVNGKTFSPGALRDAIQAAKSSPAPIQLLASSGAQIQTYSVDYHGGLRYPHLQRDSSRPNYLDEIFHPLAK